jgi:hypothetical protein
MDFIERWFGLSPDGGSGETEIVIVVTIVLAVVAAGLALRRYLLPLFTAYIEKRGKRKDGDTFE